MRRGWLKTLWSYYGAAEASAAAGAAVIRQLFYLRDHHSSLCYNLTGICCLLFHIENYNRLHLGVYTALCARKHVKMHVSNCNQNLFPVLQLCLAHFFAGHAFWCFS